MNTLLFTIDCSALLLASIWMVNYAWGFVFRGGTAGRFGAHVAGSFRWLDERCDYHLAEFAFLSVTWIAARSIFILHSAAGVSTDSAWMFTVLIGGIWALLGFPAGALVSLIMQPFCERRAIHHDKSRYFDLSEELESHWQEIQAEYDQFCARVEPVSFEEIISDISIERSTRKDHHWRAVFLRLATLDVEPVLKHFPLLGQLLNDQRVTSAFFSVLEPGVTLVPHRGYYRGVLRYHLGLHVHEPSRCELQVAGSTYHWVEGEGVLFDDMYVHSASNNGETARVVLFLDVIRSSPRPWLGVNRVVRFLVRHHPIVRYVHRRLLQRVQQEVVPT